MRTSPRAGRRLRPPRETGNAWVAMVDDWLTHRETGDDVLMLATERATVADLNRLARAQLVAWGTLLDARAPVRRQTTTARSSSESATTSSCSATSGSLNPRDNRRRPPGRSHGRDTAGWPRRCARRVRLRADRRHRPRRDRRSQLLRPQRRRLPSVRASRCPAVACPNRIYATRDRAWIDASVNTVVTRSPSTSHPALITS